MSTVAGKDEFSASIGKGIKRLENRVKKLKDIELASKSKELWDFLDQFDTSNLLFEEYNNRLIVHLGDPRLWNFVSLQDFKVDYYCQFSLCKDIGRTLVRPFGEYGYKFSLKNHKEIAGCFHGLYLKGCPYSVIKDLLLTIKEKLDTTTFETHFKSLLDYYSNLVIKEQVV
jgi:hypothetical protein